MARVMKDSGVRWIGDIPNNWNTSKLKYHVQISSGDTFPPEYQSDEELFPLYGGGELMGYSNKSNAKVGSLIVGRVGSCGSVNCPEKDFWATDNALIIKSALPLRYSYYLLIAANLKSLSTSNAQPLITSTKIKNVSIPLPPLAEQKAIADFLDAKCGEIDGLLSDLDAEINVLQDYKKSIIAEVTTQGLNPNVKMKPSGIDWIGKIPAHWQVVPFRSYVVERAEKNLGGRNQNLLALSFALGVTRYADKKYNMDRVKDDFSGYQIVHEKDLVLSPNDIIKGSIFVSEYKGCISPMYRVFSNYDQNTYNLYYLSYHLRTKESGRKFFYIARGLIGEMLDNGKYVTRRMSVSQQDLLKFKVLLPPIEEQNEIVRYLDLKCASIEQAIKDKNNQIETLKAYKSSLIYEYVTGKKQVL